MTISTENMKSFLISYFVLNFIAFLLFKSFVLNNFLGGQSELLVYSSIVMLALVTSFVYILIDVHFTRKRERQNMNSAYYVEEYDCYLFMGYSNGCILTLKKDMCNIYFNSLYFAYAQLQINKSEYIERLKSRFIKLNTMDKIFIYINKYINVVLMSVLLFVASELYNAINVSNDFFVNLTIIIRIMFLSFALYLIVTKIFELLITKIMKKRNLEFFMNN